MSCIYLDPTALFLPSGNPDQPAERVAPGASAAVAHLVQAGFAVVVLEAVPGRLGRDLPDGVSHAAALPARLEPDAWYLTGDPDPAFGRPMGGTTVLVGPQQRAGRFPHPRFDLETRDMASATMEILTRQAMA